MKSKTASILKLTALCASLVAFDPTARAQLSIPNADGSDGVLIVSNNTVIDLSLAGTGAWTSPSANPGKGTYDSNQWAVVFKYSNVVISNGATLSFANHATHAPVVWLVNGNVTVNGVLSLDGQGATTDPVHLTEPGPGGFRGAGGVTYGYGGGFGPGGGLGDHGAGQYSGYYGNPQIFPLIGGSGSSSWNENGGAGGGAILIAVSGTISINNYCHANGGSGFAENGSGGGIRLVADQIQGSGTIQALGGNNSYVGGPGRIRLEGNTVSPNLVLNPNTGTVQPANPPPIFPATNAPVVTIVSVGGLSAPADPKAAMNSSGNDDVILNTTSSVTIQLRTVNFPTNGVVNVYIKPRNALQTILQATFDSGNTNLANWHVNAALNYAINQGHTVIQARAIY